MQCLLLAFYYPGDLKNSLTIIDLQFLYLYQRDTNMTTRDKSVLSWDSRENLERNTHSTGKHNEMLWTILKGNIPTQLCIESLLCVIHNIQWLRYKYWNISLLLLTLLNPSQTVQILSVNCSFFMTVFSERQREYEHSAIDMSSHRVSF